MPRPRTFSPDEVLRLAAQAFTVGGYEATSVDDLLQALNLHRGSLYKAFGSKRGLFLAVLTEYVRTALPIAIRAATDSGRDEVEELTAGSELDLLLVAAVERGHSDTQVAALVREALDQLNELPVPRSWDSTAGPTRSATVLGTRLHRRLLPLSPPQPIHS